MGCEQKGGFWNKLWKTLLITNLDTQSRFIRMKGPLCPSSSGARCNASLHLLPSVFKTKHLGQWLHAGWVVLLSLSEVETTSACREDFNGKNA